MVVLGTVGVSIHIIDEDPDPELWESMKQFEQQYNLKATSYSSVI
jgi:hypothetical protein